MTKPALFIASSVEGLYVADAINENLDHDVHCTVWRTGTFKLSSQTIDDLVKKSSMVDFAVFVFTPDDLTTIREKQHATARDNVIFELGLFIGAIGKDRCYVVKPRDVEMHLPSDLLGMNTADYVADRPDGDISSALNLACKQIKDRIKEKGAIDRSPFSKQAGPARHVANPPDYKLQDNDLRFLAVCVRSTISDVVGIPFHQIANQMQSPDPVLALSAIKLSKLGYIQKTNASDDQGWEYFAFSATEDGTDAFLKHEDRIIELSAPAPRPGKRNTPPRSTGFDDMDDDIPF